MSLEYQLLTCFVVRFSNSQFIMAYFEIWAVDLLPSPGL